MPGRKIEYVILHCSDSLWGCARTIREWHTAPSPDGRGFRDIGYQFVILNGRPTNRLYLPALDGAMECGRYLDENLHIEERETGAHAFGYNAKSIGICLVGIDRFSDSQLRSLSHLLRDICTAYGIPYDNVLGHCETESGKSQGKTCPNFDVRAFMEIMKAEYPLQKV